MALSEDYIKWVHTPKREHNKNIDKFKGVSYSDGHFKNGETFKNNFKKN